MNDFNRVIVADLETSGLNLGRNGIISIGAVPLIGDEEFYLELRIDLNQEADGKALEINGFTQEDCRNPLNPDQKEGVKQFYKWVEGKRYNWGGGLAILGGHNIRFDAGHLQHVRPSWPFAYRMLDLHALAFGVLGKSLCSEEICDELGLRREPTVHNALEGAKMAKRGLLKLIDLTCSLKGFKATVNNL